MRLVPLFILLLACSGVAHAQLSAPSPGTSVPRGEPDAPRRAIEQRTERIHVEDSSVRIDEIRVAGETRSIRVQPKLALPPYEVAPVSGQRSWKVLDF